MHRLHINRNLVAGLMFAAVGAAGLWIAGDYPRGTALRMGPGYMPVMLCWGLVLLGPAGLALATLVIVLLGAAGGREFRFLEALALALGLAAGAVILFVYGLKLPMPVWPSGLF